MFSPEASTWKGRLRVPLLDRIHCLGFPDRADDGVRTRGLLLGKQACCHCTTSASRGTGSGPMTLGLWGRPVDGPAGPAVSRAAGGRPLSAYSIAGARRLDMTSFLGMSALTRGGMPHVVEPAGFEPATFPLRTGRPATGRRPRSAPDPIRTGDTRIRNPVLCPLSYKGVHPPCDDMRPRTGGRIRGGSWRWRGRGRENKRRKNPSRMPSFPRAYSVACGRRSRHEPLRAPDRTRSGDLPLTRRTLCLLSYRGECRKTPAVRRRPPRTRHMGPDREEGHAIVRSEGRAVSAARARRPDPAGAGPPFRAPWRSRTSVYGFGDRRAAAVPMARSLFPLFGFQPCHAGRVRGGMAWYASPDGRPAERVPPAEWFRVASLRRPARLIRAALLDWATKPTEIPSSHDQVSSRLLPFAVNPMGLA